MLYNWFISGMVAAWNMFECLLKFHERVEFDIWRRTTPKDVPDEEYYRGPLL